MLFLRRPLTGVLLPLRIRFCMAEESVTMRSIGLSKAAKSEAKSWWNIKTPRCWAISNGCFTVSNIYRYDFAGKKVTPLTHFEQEWAGDFCLSPDGQWIVFTRKKVEGNASEVALWTMRSDGSNMRLLVHHAWAPAWGRGSNVKPRDIKNDPFRRRERHCDASVPLDTAS